MLRQTEPRLRRADVVLNSFGSCISDAPEKLSRAPEVSFSEIASQPRMFVQKFKGAITFKQLKRFAHRHRRWQLDEKMHVICSDVQLIDAASPTLGSFSDEALAIAPQAEKLEKIHGVFRLPHEVKSILPEGMSKTLQIHFLLPARHEQGKLTLSKFFISDRDVHSHPFSVQQFKKLNFMEGRIPPMLESIGILRHL